MAKSSEAQIADIGRELSALVEGATRDIGRSLIAELPAVTPRDTGFTAANWRASRGAPVTAAVGSRSNVGGAKAAQDSSRSEVESFKLSRRHAACCEPVAECRSSQRRLEFSGTARLRATRNCQSDRECGGEGGGARRGGAAGQSVTGGGGEPLPGLLAIRSGAEG